MKQIKFSPELVPLIKNGSKTCTWRLWDDKDLQEGDEVIFIQRPELTPFAIAELTKVTNKKFGELGEEDYIGHEKYDDPYKVCSDYYHREVVYDTPLTVVQFVIKKWIVDVGIMQKTRWSGKYFLYFVVVSVGVLGIMQWLLQSRSCSSIFVGGCGIGDGILFLLMMIFLGVLLIVGTVGTVVGKKLNIKPIKVYAGAWIIALGLFFSYFLILPGIMDSVGKLKINLLAKPSEAPSEILNLGDYLMYHPVSLKVGSTATIVDIVDLRGQIKKRVDIDQWLNNYTYNYELSPNGEYLAYVNQTGFYIKKVGAPEKTVEVGKGLYVVKYKWSGESDQIIFWDNREEMAGSKQVVKKYDLATGSIYLTDKGEAAENYSPNREFFYKLKLSELNKYSGYAFQYKMEVYRNSGEFVGSSDRVGDERDPVWSRDSRFIAYSNENDGIYIFDVKESKEYKVSRENARNVRWYYE